MHLLSMLTQARSLPKFLLALVNSASVWIKGGMSVYMLHQILLLCKISAAQLTLESLEAQMNGNEMPFKTEFGREIFAAIIDSADDLIVKKIGLALEHFVQKVLDSFINLGC